MIQDMYVLVINGTTAGELSEWIEQVPPKYVISVQAFEALDYEECLVAMREK